MQQYLPLAVLKQLSNLVTLIFMVNISLQQYLPLAVLKLRKARAFFNSSRVATVPTACGIETTLHPPPQILVQKLQQYLPLAVLKRDNIGLTFHLLKRPLQQYLPLAVLKHIHIYTLTIIIHLIVATVPTACGIETCSDVGL